MKLAQGRSLYELPFEFRASLALIISIVADALDYIGAPIFALPIIGDIADLMVTGLLYRITKSKVSVVINAIEFIPIIGDFIPTYTISTLLWILNQSRKRSRKSHRQAEDSIIIKSSRHDTNGEKEDLRTRIHRAYAILRNK